MEHPKLLMTLLSLVLLHVGCANLSQLAPAPPQPPTYGNRFKVTIVSANIAELRPDGRPWHTQEPDASIPLLNTIASLSANPVVMAVAPVIFKDDKAGRPISPSPMVRMQAGAGTFETPTKRTDLAPAWEYPFAVDVRALTPESPVQIAVIDADGRTVMDEFEVVARDLLGKPETVFAGTSVTGLRVRVEPLPDVPEHQTYRFRVPANESLEDLAARTSGPRFAGDWMPVQVLNGDVVRIVAVGQVSPSSLSGATCGPTGFEDGHLSRYNRHDFSDVPHASLVAYVHGEPRYVGVGQKIEIAKAGRLLLGVNDRDVSNNSGAFDVVVELNPPRLVRDRMASPSFVAPAWQQPSPPANGGQAVPPPPAAPAPDQVLPPSP